MRIAAFLLVLGLAACGPSGKPDPNFAGSAAEPSEALRAQVDGDNPFTGQWSLDPKSCGDTNKVWTIQTKRMGIPEAERFCLFNRLFANDAGDGEKVWSADASCEHKGRTTQDFLFFRLSPDWKQMRVTLNDAPGIKLMRCLKS